MNEGSLLFDQTSCEIDADRVYSFLFISKDEGD